jgi:calmodulin
VKTIMAELGQNGLIDLARFQQCLQQRPKPSGDQDEAVREAFKVFDKSGTGLVETKELRHILTSLGEKLSVPEVDGVLKEADTDNDGKITVQDFIRVLKSVKA